MNAVPLLPSMRCCWRSSPRAWLSRQGPWVRRSRMRWTTCRTACTKDSAALLSRYWGWADSNKAPTCRSHGSIKSVSSLCGVAQTDFYAFGLPEGLTAFRTIGLKSRLAAALRWADVTAAPGPRRGPHTYNLSIGRRRPVRAHAACLSRCRFPRPSRTLRHRRTGSRCSA